MKDRVEVVELENEKLLQNLKLLSAEHIMREQTLPDASVNFCFSVLLISVQRPYTF